MPEPVLSSSAVHPYVYRAKQLSAEQAWCIARAHLPSEK